MSSLISKAQEKGKGFGHFHHTAFAIAALTARRPGARGRDWLEQAAADGYPCYRYLPKTRARPHPRDVAFQRFLSAQRRDGSVEATAA
jgi:hypothetical protein